MGADEYAIIPAGTLEEESTPRVVCTRYPQISECVHGGVGPIDDETWDRLDEALRTVDRWEDEPRERLDQIRRELYEMEPESGLEPELHREVRPTRAHVRSYTDGPLREGGAD